MTLDHRPVVAAQRREKMRARLVEAAVLVVAAKGLANTVIDDVAVQAGVSRGTFYNYFPSVPDLMIAAHQEISNEIAVAVHAIVLPIPDPDQRVATSIAMFLATARSYPVFGQFISGMGNQGWGKGDMIADLMPRHLADGVAVGDFCELPLSLAYDLLTATISATLQRECNGEVVDLTALLALLLRALGVSRERAAELAALDVAPLVAPPESLVARSHAIWAQNL
jgi:AcrR family transcriptional regulator